ncbi:MAG: hypothetical protein K8W52_27960 [Deltaproteobacteria bacterium]|nr:hypothetical protein [Deltaproteobacteria bacterium]
MRVSSGLAFAILSLSVRAAASPPDPGEYTEDEPPPSEPECGDSPSDDPTALDVAIVLGNRGIGAGRPIEMACEGTWLHYCPPLQATICAASGLSAIDTTRVDRAPIELLATTTTTITFDGTAFKLKGTPAAPDRRAFTLDIGRRHAQIRTSPGGRSGQLPLAFTIAGPSEAQGELLVSVPGLLPELDAYAGGRLRWAGEREADATRAAAKGVLFLDEGEIVGAYPRDLTAALGDVRYLARLVVARGDLCAVARRADAAARTIHLAISDRVTGATVLERDLPALVKSGPCTREYDRSWPDWPTNAFAPELAAALDGLLARTAPAWPRFDAKAAGRRAALTRVLGLATPTVAELARILGNDRIKLATAIDSIYGAFETDGQRLTELNVRLDSRDRVARLGLRDPIVELVGKNRAALLALLGPPDGDPGRDYLTYTLTSGGATIKLVVSIDDDIVGRISLDWRLAP